MTTEAFLLAFRYDKGGLLEPWRDVSKSEQPRGDCQTFAWSVLILETGGKLQAVKALLTGRAMIWRAKSPVNGLTPRHAVLWLRGKGWIDSTRREWRDSPAPHRRAWPVGTPVLAILAALFLASPLRAGDSAFWDKTGCSLVLIEGEAWVAEIRCVNFLTPMSPSDVTAELQAGDLAVQLYLSQTFGKTPDRFTVIPPTGYIASPPEIDVEEDGAGVIRLMPYVGF